jgi:hypothetical protein
MELYLAWSIVKKIKIQPLQIKDLR